MTRETTTRSGMAALCGAAAATLWALASAGQARAQPPLWTVRDADSTIVLFGSVHVLPQGLDWTPAALDQALAQADDVWFEVPLDDASNVEAQRQAAAHGYLKPGGRLSRLLSPAGRRRLSRVVQALDLAPDQLERMRPWYAELTLSAALYRLSGADMSRGVEHSLAQAAPQARRRAFETPAEQVAFFAGAPMADQVSSLEQTLKQIDQNPGDYQQLVRAWMAGDVAALDRESVQPLRKSAPKLYADLVSRRNARWADRIIERLHGSGRTVIVVGVGHLVGEDGVPARLRARGVTVEGPGESPH